MEIRFVHGAFVRDGAWWWRPAAELIERQTGIASRSILLPSCGEGGAAPGSAGLREDAAALQSALAESPSAVVVAHSYGGTVAAEGAASVALRHLVYISSYLPDVGQSQADLTGGGTDPLAVRDNGDGTLSVGTEGVAAFGERFWDDVADERMRAGAWDRLTAQSMAALGTPTSAAAWQSVDSTYLVCADDRNTSAELQRFHAARATNTIELPTGHHPFLSRPELVAGPLVELLRSL